jgi:hypothetical protein
MIGWRLLGVTGVSLAPKSEFPFVPSRRGLLTRRIEAQIGISGQSRGNDRWEIARIAGQSPNAGDAPRAAAITAVRLAVAVEGW